AGEVGRLCVPRFRLRPAGDDGGGSRGRAELTPTPPAPHTRLAREGVVPTREGVVPTREGVVPTREGVVPTREGVVPTREGVVPTREGVVVVAIHPVSRPQPHPRGGLPGAPGRSGSRGRRTPAPPTGSAGRGWPGGGGRADVASRTVARAG